MKWALYGGTRERGGGGKEQEEVCQGWDGIDVWEWKYRFFGRAR